MDRQYPQADMNETIADTWRGTQQPTESWENNVDRETANTTDSEIEFKDGR